MLSAANRAAVKEMNEKKDEPANSQRPVDVASGGVGCEGDCQA